MHEYILITGMIMTMTTVMTMIIWENPVAMDSQ